jgi:hypothetical protein
MNIWGFIYNYIVMTLRKKILKRRDMGSALILLGIRSRADHSGRAV